MRHPGDVSALEALLGAGAVQARDIVAVIGKTEGNGGVNDFTRGYFTQSLMALLARHTGDSAADWLARLPCVLSGGTEGVLSPHYLVFARTAGPALSAGAEPALAIGVAMSPPLAPEDVGRAAHIRRPGLAGRGALRAAQVPGGDGGRRPGSGGARPHGGQQRPEQGDGVLPRRRRLRRGPGTG